MVPSVICEEMVDAVLDAESTTSVLGLSLYTCIIHIMLIYMHVSEFKAEPTAD